MGPYASENVKSYSSYKSLSNYFKPHLNFHLNSVQKVLFLSLKNSANLTFMDFWHFSIAFCGESFTYDPMGEVLYLVKQLS